MSLQRAGGSAGAGALGLLEAFQQYLAGHLGAQLHV